MSFKTVKDLTDEELIQYYNIAKRYKRAFDIKSFKYDRKFAYHVVRLLNEVEQILIEGTLDLERNREQLKSIRRGDWTLEQITEYFESKEKTLEDLYAKSDLPHSPDEEKIKQLLLQCIEMHYGKLDANTLVRVDEASQKLKRIKEILES